MSHLHELHILAASAGLLAFFGCAHRAEVYPNNQFVMDTQRERIEARIDPNGISGPMIDIAREGDDALKGVAFNRPVFIHWANDRASGLVANSPLELTVERNESNLRARGLYTGSPVDFTVSADAISGIVRGCSYWLKGSQPAFQGFRQCGQRTQQEPTTLNLPETLQAKPDTEKMAILAFLLAQ
jgi:hypothetical protein